MKTMVILIGMALSAAGNDATAASNADSLFLENQVLRMEICRTPAPFIERLVHKASDRAVVAEPASKSLFSIAFANEDGKQETIESAAAGASDVSVTRTGGKPKEYVLNESNPAGAWKRHSYQFCVSAPQTKPFFCDVIDQTHAFGVDASRPTTRRSIARRKVRRSGRYGRTNTYLRSSPPS